MNISKAAVRCPGNLYACGFPYWAITRCRTRPQPTPPFRWPARQGLPVSEAAIREGFSRVDWPGRFEVLQRNPMLVIDSAHNRDSALKLRLTLDDYLPGKPVILVVWRI